MKHFSVILFGFLILAFFPMMSCKKGAGEGGRASIKGRIFTVNYNASMIFPTDSGYLGGQKVYIIYGDETAVGDNQDSNNDGEFEFRYLRKGKYKVYVYSKTANAMLDSAIVQECEITEKKQVLELPDFRIKTNKN